MHATQQEIDKAIALGYTHFSGSKSGSSFVKVARRVWGIREGWQTADIERGYYCNHHAFNTLSDALERSTTKEG